MPEKDPDIIRWSTLKGFGKHCAIWFIFYGIAGWLIDINQYADNSLTSMMLWLVGISLFMAGATWGNR
jgi:uncharacterized membrane protein